MEHKITIKFHSETTMLKFKKFQRTEKLSKNNGQILFEICKKMQNKPIPNFTQKRGERMQMPTICVAGISTLYFNKIKEIRNNLKPITISDVVNQFCYEYLK